MPKSDTQFKKGQSGNPNGRSKKLADLAVKISELDDAHRLRLESIAASGEPRDSIAAIKLLWAYAHGNPSQPITGPDNGPIKFQSVDLLESLKALVKPGG